MTPSSSPHPSLVEAMERWALSSPSLVTETASSVIYRANDCERGPVALKLLKPGAGNDETRGGALLAWYSGHGAVKVFGVAPDAVLMEWLGGESLGDVARSGRDGIATGILCDVVERLHTQRSTPPPELTPLRQRFASLFRTDLESRPSGARAHVAKAMVIARDLLDAETPAEPLHGDIHHDNVLHNGDDWKAIDPKGLIGDPAYDYANSFQNPERAETLVLDATRIGRHAKTISEQTGINRKRLLAWAVAHTALSGAWNMEDDSSFSHQTNMLALLLPILEDH